jgi:hypothetical protein
VEKGGCWFLQNLVSDATVGLVPGVANEDHFADGVVEPDVLKENRRLVDSLIVAESTSETPIIQDSCLWGELCRTSVLENLNFNPVL